ncbi:putative papain-like cysteine peptidase superfamily [Helianthus debilis subsp. tardiflorus]
MKTYTCYYLDSIRNSTINPVLGKLLMRKAMVLYAIQSINWVNAKCPYQMRGTEFGYYVLKFIKEVVEEGIEVLANENVGGGKVVYMNEDIDRIREGCSSYGATFVFNWLFKISKYVHQTIFFVNVRYSNYI